VSRRWLDEHHGDRYVREAREQGYRSRAAFKLKELIERDRLLKPGMAVVDLGAAPGGWSQVAAGLVGPSGTVVATDILAMEPVRGVQFVHGDFTEPAVQSRIVDALGGRRADLVISDMAPNITGVRVTDQARSLELVETAIEFAMQVLQPGGALLVKVFQGADVTPVRDALRRAFTSVSHRKPAASRARSSEFYLLARGFKAPAEVRA
jgi:23S rRNA (uridine2552-2'-O)-methyltransferase